MYVYKVFHKLDSRASLPSHLLSFGCTHGETAITRPLIFTCATSSAWNIPALMLWLSLISSQSLDSAQCPSFQDEDGIVFSLEIHSAYSGLSAMPMCPLTASQFTEHPPGALLCTVKCCSGLSTGGRRFSSCCPSNRWSMDWTSQV